MTTEINIDVKAKPTHALFTLKSGAEVHIPMPLGGMASISDTLNVTRPSGTLIFGIDDSHLDAIIAVSEIAAVQPSWERGALDRMISYPRTS